MQLVKTWLRAMAVGLLMTGSVLAQERGTKEEAVAMVIAALDHMKKVGNEKALQDFTKDKANWVKKDLYVMVYNGKNVGLAHGANEKIVGRDMSEVKDVNGVPVPLSRLITGTLAQAAAQAAALADGDLRSSDYQAPRDETGRVMDALESTAQGLSNIVRQVRESECRPNQCGGVRNCQRQPRSFVSHRGDRLGPGHQVRCRQRPRGQSLGIAEIIGTIDGIAFQTNILALNAAVEAARAGEQGRGFAVVASEVRLLAQRSAEAAKEIRSLIQSSVERIDGGVSKVQQAGQTMNRIVEAIGRVSQMVDDVTRAASEQANGIAQVHEAVSDMDRNTQQNAAMVEEAAAAATLQQQAEGLVASSARFRL